MSKKVVNVGINGLGRIGRTILRKWLERGDTTINIVAANDLGPAETYLHLIKYDSTHGRLNASITLDNNTFHVNGHSIKYYSIKNPAEIPWGDHKVDVVIDSTGVFKDTAELSRHIHGTVKKVILCAPGEVDATLVMGINHETYDATKHNVVSNGSCTTNCLAPVVKVLNDTFGIVEGFMTTIHSYTLDQNILDSFHKDLRRARSGAANIIPTSTGAAKAIGEVIPSLKGKLDGYAVRVPTSNVSLVDLSVTLKKTTTKQEVNEALKNAAKTTLKGIMTYSDEPLVSCDYNGMKESSCVDTKLTNCVGSTCKVVAWYDNESGFSNRVLDLASFVGERI